MSKPTPVYGDLRLANINNSTVTITTGDKARSLYDPVNFAVPTADSGSTLYSVTNGSTIVYDSHTAAVDGANQNGLSQADRPTDLASLKRYNTSLIAQLTAGPITPDQHESRIQAAAPLAYAQVTVRTPVIPTYTAPPTISERQLIKIDRSSLVTTATSQLVGGRQQRRHLDADPRAEWVDDRQQRLDRAGGERRRPPSQGCGQQPDQCRRRRGRHRLRDARPFGRHTDTDRIDGPAGLRHRQHRDPRDANIVNQGVVNVTNRDIPGHAENPSYGKANTGIAVSSGATASNNGTILIGGAGSAVANTLGLFGGAAGLVAFDGGTATNTAQVTIRVGTTFTADSTDLAGVVDVVSVNYAAGMTSLSGGGTLVNDGLIRIGSLTQNATGMLVGGDGNTALNTGQIVIDPSATIGPSAHDVGIAVRGSSVAGAVEATNAASGTITVSGVNAVGLLVENSVAAGSARAVNAATIVTNGGISADERTSAKAGLASKQTGGFPEEFRAPAGVRKS